MSDTIEIPPGTQISLVSTGPIFVNIEPPPGPVEPPVEPPPTPDDYVGAHPDVETLSLNVSGYPIPEERGPIVTPEQFGAHGDGTHDDTHAIISAINAIPPDCGTLDLRGRYGIKGSNRFSRKDNLTIRGTGPGSGFVNLPQPFPGNRWRCGLEFDKTENLVLRDFSFDGNDQKIGCIYHGDDINTWLVSLYIHSVSGGPSAGDTPLAAIKGAGINTRFQMVGCKIENLWGKADANSGVRGYWGGDESRDSGIEHCIARRCGHTGFSMLTEVGCHVTHITSVDNAGAGWKPEVPVARESNPTWTPTTVCWTLKSYFADNKFTGIQFECPGQLIADCLIRNQAKGITSWNRSRASTIKNCRFEDIGDDMVFFSSELGNQLADLTVRNNTATGGYNSCCHFSDKCRSWGGSILIHDNKVTRGPTPTPSLTAYPGYRAEDNGPGEAGSDKDWKHP